MTLPETDRLVLHKLSVADAPFIVALVNTPGWLQYIGDRGIKNIADAENYIITGPMASYTKNGFGLYLVRLKSTAAPIGMCGIIKRDSLEHEDIGFALLPPYTGKGYAFEAAAAVLQYAREALGLKKILAITLAANQPSVNLLTKLGLVFQKMIISPDKEELMLFSSL